MNIWQQASSWKKTPYSGQYYPPFGGARPMVGPPRARGPAPRVPMNTPTNSFGGGGMGGFLDRKAEAAAMRGTVPFGGYGRRIPFQNSVPGISRTAGAKFNPAPAAPSPAEILNSGVGAVKSGAGKDLRTFAMTSSNLNIVRYGGAGVAAAGVFGTYNNLRDGRYGRAAMSAGMAYGGAYAFTRPEKVLAMANHMIGKINAAGKLGTALERGAASKMGKFLTRFTV